MMTFAEFEKQYVETFNAMMKYAPHQIGARVYGEKLAQLSDAHPDWAEAVENKRSTNSTQGEI